MKKIEFSGKNCKDKIKKLNDISFIPERECMRDIDYKYFDNKSQINLINKIYLNNLNESELLIKSVILKEINKKILSYKNQDINKNKFENKNINQDEVIEKLVSSKLKCFYCKSNCYLLYKKVRDSYQWTLDRIDNNLSHENDNVIICCLKCNLERRCQNKDKFLFTKQLKIEKS